MKGIQILFQFKISLLFLLLSCESDPILINSVSMSNCSVSSIDYTSAVIQFTVSGNPNKVGVLYGTDQELSTNTEIVYSDVTTGNISISVRNLRQGTEYYYKVFAENKKGNRLYGNKSNFITKSSTVMTGNVTNVTFESATVSMSFTGTGISEAGIMYTMDELCKDSVITVSVSNPVNTNLSFELKDLKSGKNYYYKAYIKYVNGSIDYGEIKLFLTEEAYLNVSTTTIKAVAEGGTYQFEIEAKNVEWKISCDQDWCEVTPETGNGNMTIDISVDKNLYADKRTVTLVIKGGDEVKTILIEQAENLNPEGQFSLSTLAHYCGYSGMENMYFTISSNENWNISTKDDWCEIITKSGSGNGVVFFTIKENSLSECRIATIDIEFPNKIQQFYVLQNYKNNPITCGVYSNSIIGFKIKSPTSWTAKSSEMWCQLKETSGENGDTFHFSYSDESLDRVAIITIESGGYSSFCIKEQRSSEIYISSELPSYETVFVQGGTFSMGSNLYTDTQPIHKVSLSDFYIGKYEVTQKLWKYVMGTNPSHYRGDDLPVEWVSLNDIDIFITRLNSITGLSYRLPTEAEWEFAASGGINTHNYVFSGSDTFEEVGWSDVGAYSGHTTVFVGMKKPNELGIYDMTGNVGEYCSDWYGVYSKNEQINPTGPNSNTEGKVVRGFKSVYVRGNCTGDIRERYSLQGMAEGIGFRLVLDN